MPFLAAIGSHLGFKGRPSFSNHFYEEYRCSVRWVHCYNLLEIGGRILLGLMMDQLLHYSVDHLPNVSFSVGVLEMCLVGLGALFYKVCEAASGQVNVNLLATKDQIG